MSGAQRAALDALNAARPIVARLDVGRNSEDLAADLIESWNVVESGLRSLVGGSALTGQTLIRELRQRQLLSLEQANSLAEFFAARERAARTDYKPTANDVAAARDAFLKLEAGMLDDTSRSSASPGSSSTFAPGGASASPYAPRPAGSPPPPSRRPTVPLASTPVAAADAVPITPVRRARPAWFVPLLAVVALLVVGGLAWYALVARGGSNKSYEDGVAAYRTGRREAAAGAFIKATKDNPADPMPHIYLSRMAREAGNLSTAQEEAVKAVQLGPSNALAMRELASVSFAQQNYDGARRFYIRALQLDPTDQLAEGYLGCSLVRLGRLDEGVRWIQRAGPGAWTACAPAPGTVPAGTMPQGMTPTGAQPMAPR
ncbi:MAG TPA: tetratricopeptide repeat protein [Gemmatimonadaceae bacterium]|nr:tetratricopeptide repeat protein [Gemmatimonadaceae bacterium]